MHDKKRRRARLPQATHTARASAHKTASCPLLQRICNKKTSRTVSRVMYLMIICLGPMLPPASSDLPDNRPGRPIVVHLSEFGLASDGVYMATDVTTGTVVSYTAFPPLPRRRKLHFLQTPRSAVCLTFRCVSFSPQRRRCGGPFYARGLDCADVAVYLCCTGLGVTSTGRYPASCPMKPGLSSPAFAAAIICPTRNVYKIIPGRAILL